jgi:hypothetical protein
MSADALQRLVARHVTAAAAGSPSLAERAITPHGLRHAAVMEMLRHGVDRSVIALRLGRESMETTQPDRLVHAPCGEILAPPYPRRFGPLSACFDFDLHGPPRHAFLAAPSSVAYYWGERPETARSVAPGETITFTQYLVSSSRWWTPAKTISP